MHLHDVDSAICLDSSFGPVYHLNNHVINGSPSGVKKKKGGEKKEKYMKVLIVVIMNQVTRSSSFLIHVKKPTFCCRYFRTDLLFYR